MVLLLKEINHIPVNNNVLGFFLKIIIRRNGVLTACVMEFLTKKL